MEDDMASWSRLQVPAAGEALPGRDEEIPVTESRVTGPGASGRAGGPRVAAVAGPIASGEIERTGPRG